MSRNKRPPNRQLQYMNNKKENDMKTNLEQINEIDQGSIDIDGSILPESFGALLSTARKIDRDNSILQREKDSLWLDNKALKSCLKQTQSNVFQYKDIVSGMKKEIYDHKSIVEDLKSVLEFYANKQHIGKDCNHYPVVKDDGEKAREVLDHHFKQLPK